LKRPKAAATIELRDVRSADLPVLFEHQADTDAARLAAFKPRDLEAFMAHWTKILSDPSLCAKAIVLGRTVVGNIGVFGHANHREVGYWIGREHWGQGFATAALRAILRLRTERPLFAHVAEHNSASIRVLEKCGFRLLGEDPEFSACDEAPVRGFVYRIG
jgi:RimJ/RimL family protein N-acetyltransferase